MALIRWAALGALGYAGYRYLQARPGGRNAAFADNQGDPEGFSRVRDAGPAAMADAPARTWTKADEESDESFPASDPPANY